MTNSIEDYINRKKELQLKVINILDSTEESNYDDSVYKQIKGNCYELDLFLRFITNICNNYHRSESFLENLEKILLHFKNDFIHDLLKAKLFNKTQRNMVSF